MGTGQRGAFVISWGQTRLDGIAGAPRVHLAIGAPWGWAGEAVRVDGAPDIRLPDAPRDAAQARRHIAQAVGRLVGRALDAEPPAADTGDRGFVVTDGQRSYTATEIATGPGRAPLLLFIDALPPADTQLWVLRLIDETLHPPRTHGDMTRGVICFAAGTRIDTPEGALPVESLGPGDRVLTKDDGAQEILWLGRRRMTGARLYAMPHLRPVRIRAGALGGDRPAGDLWVSPRHRVLVAGRTAEALFDSPEVLVAAEDLVNDRTITYDHALPEVTYIHLMLDRHQVVWANGVETESFHPASTSLDTVLEDQRADLLRVFPQVADDPFSYGDFSRRCLTASEAAILRDEAPFDH